MRDATDTRTTYLQIRCLLLLSASDRAGLAPVSTSRFHTFAYLLNALAPVWRIPPVDFDVVKSRPGPHYPELQQDLDHLVGRGLVAVADLRYDVDSDGKWFSDARYQLIEGAANRALEAALSFPEERKYHDLAVEVLLAVSGMTPSLVEESLGRDASYGDERVGYGSLLDLRLVDRTARVAELFSAFGDPGETSPADQVQLYLRHLGRLGSAS